MFLMASIMCLNHEPLPLADVTIIRGTVVRLGIVSMLTLC